MGLLRDILRDVVRPCLLDVSDRWWSRSPITVRVVYDGVTQGQIRFKLPIGKTIIVHDGSGVNMTYQGADGGSLIHTTSYSIEGEYILYVSGDVYAITYIRINEYIHAPMIGSIGRWGELKNLESVLLSSANNMYGDISVLAKCPLLSTINIAGSEIYGDLSTLFKLVNLTSLNATRNNVVFLRPYTFTGSFSQINISSGNMTGEMIDNALAAFSHLNDAVITLGFGNRTSASNNILLTMMENGNTIFVSEDSENSAGIPMDVELHTDANAVSDPNGNEVDATTGWSESGLNGTGNNVFESQESVVAVGNRAFRTDANDTPTVDAGINKDFTVVASNIIRTYHQWRHIGVGGGWVNSIEGVYSTQYISYEEVDWQGMAVYYKALDTILSVRFDEYGATNDGGIYMDNFSARKVANSPVVFKIEYDGATQFDFKFKLPSASSIDIYEGDGTMTNVVGQDSTEVTHSTTYAAAGIYYFYLEGDYADLTEINISSQGFTSDIVDNALIRMADGGLLDCVINIGGTNAARTSASDSAKDTLIANGCTVTVNE